MTRQPEPLSDLERDVLAFEARQDWYHHRETHEWAARDLFELSGTRYTQVINAALRKPAAELAQPVFVRRARRLAAQGRGLWAATIDPRQHRARLKIRE